MKISEVITEGWSQKYKSSINCSHPKGFSQKAHCAGKKKHTESMMTMEATCPDCGMCQTHGNLNEIKKGAKDSNGFTRCWPGKHAEGTKKGKNGGPVRNCVPNEGVAEGLNEFAADGGGDSGNYFQALASAWYNGTFDTGSLQKGIKSKEDVERLLHRGVLCPDGVTRKYGIDYNGAFDGVEIYSDDYYEHGDHDATIDSRTGQKWGPYDHMEFSDEDLSESIYDSTELAEEFDLIESIIDSLADRNGVDADMIWEDLESLTNDELYVFAVTTPIMEDWQKANKRDRTSGMSQKAVNAYRREHPGSKLKTAVTTKPSKLKRGSKASKRRKSYCSRSRGQMKMHNISCAKTPDKAICKARRRWNC